MNIIIEREFSKRYSKLVDKIFIRIEEGVWKAADEVRKVQLST